MSLIDNGGAIAIKGFNYQKACIIYVIVRNYQKDNFKIIPEAQDDFEVHFDDKSIFVQVKGTKKLSIANMSKGETTKKLKYNHFRGNIPKGTIFFKNSKIKKKLIKKNVYQRKLSIIEKNLVPGNDGDKRKIFLFDMTASTKDSLVESSVNGELVTTLYSLSDTQKDNIINRLELSENQILRLSNQHIYITPFENSITSSIPAIYGEMVAQDLIITKDRANTIFKELAFLIDQKSELIIRNIPDDLLKKEINFDVIEPLFLTAKELDYFEEVLKNLTLNTLLRKQIKRCKIFLIQTKRYLKSEVMKEVNIEELFQSPNDDHAIGLILSVIKNKDEAIGIAESYALAIECFCELGE